MPGLRARLDEAEATIQAIRTGEVDAVVVSGPEGERTLTFEGATHPYQVLLNAMSDGAALLAPDGTVLFANRRLAEIVRGLAEDLRGSLFQELVAPAERPRFAVFLRDCAGGAAAGEFATLNGDATATPVWIAVSAVSPAVLMAIITDLTARKQAEATRLGLMRRLIAAEDEERRRIARELHDETGQALTALLVGLRALEEQAVTRDVQVAARRLRSMTAETVENVGRLARGLHPSVLDDQGLAAAAERYVSDYVRSHGIAVNLTLEPIRSRRFAPLVQTTMYRVLQEALTNVARHAQASAVGVDLTLDGTILELTVADDGTGFDTRAVGARTAGLGLQGMRERVALMDGTVAVESRPGHGTTIRARIPAGKARRRAPD